MMCIDYDSVIQSCTALQLRCALLSHPSSVLPSPWSLYRLHSLPFTEWHIVEIIWYSTFSDWLLSLNNMDLGVLHVFLWLDSWLLFIVEQYSIVWMYHTLFIHSPTEGQLGRFQVWEIIPFSLLLSISIILISLLTAVDALEFEVYTL